MARTIRHPYIAAWGEMMGSYGYYIANQQAQAAADNAPRGAIYQAQDGTWVTVSDVGNPKRRDRLHATVARLESGVK